MPSSSTLPLTHPLQDWVDANGKGKGPADPLKPSNTRAALAADAAKRDAELRSQFVVVPPGDEAKTVACPICKESLKSEFQEDDEEWVWKNAVDVDGRVRCFPFLHFGLRVIFN